MDTPVITLSDPGFYRKITGKYRKGRRNPFGYPVMMFFKNALQPVSQRINMNVLVQFHFHNQNITSSLIAKSVRGIKALLQWFKVETFIPLNKTGFSGVLPMGIPDERLLLFLKSVVSRAGDGVTVSNKIMHQLFLMHQSSSGANAAALPQASRHLAGFGNRIQIIKPRTMAVSPDHGVKVYSPAEYPGAWEYKFVFECKSPAVIPQVNLLLNSRALSSAAVYPPGPNKSFNTLTPVANRKLTGYNKYVQIINPEYHSVFETATLPQANLLLNLPALSGNALLSGQVYNLFPDYSVSAYRSPAILPNVNLLLNRWTASSTALYPAGIFNVFSHAETLNLYNRGYFNYPGDRSNYKFSVGGGRPPTILPYVGLLLSSRTAQGTASYGQEIYNTSPQETMEKQPAGYGSYVHISNPAYRSEYKSYSSSSGLKPEFYSTYNIPPQTVNLHFTGYSDYPRIINLKYHSAFGRKSPAVIPQMNIFLSSTVPLHKSEGLPDRGYQTATFIKPFIEPDTRGHAAVSLAPLKKPDTMKDNDKFYFQNNQKIEQAIEQVKKIAEEARQTAVDGIRSAHSPGETEMRYQVDINRLSDEVYQLIDRRIKIERERRGYI